MSCPPAPVTPTDRGVYVHFPYCEKKCPYCDFNSHAVAHDDGAYADAILAELAGRAHELGPGAVRSIFFGGGTPSLWDPPQVGRVIAAVEATFGFSEAPEITLEANPGTVVPDRFKAYVAHGVNRFSIGAQSFTDRELVSLGRIHGADQAHRAVAAALDTGARVSLDLMYGLPGQSWADVARSVERATALEPHHISAYTLTIEPDTALGRRTRLGLFTPMEDDDQAGLIHDVTAALAAAGYQRYEISNYAREGFEAVHNSLYWTGGPYLGLGAGAHSYAPAPDLSAAVRRENVKAPETYLQAALAGDFTPRSQEDLDRWGVVADRLWVGLRPRWGVDVEALAEQSGLGASLLEALLPALEGLAGRGLVARHGPRWAPTAEGFLFADLIARTLLDAVPAGP
ncbi:MAG: radical SAM family heme chaperone HemW [Deltaproteobacteria bacterium]|nr:radical SAM family heme chaperone HemW [Deltaproteobacteria bacterium]